MCIDGAIGIDMGYTACACVLHGIKRLETLKIHRNIDRLVDVSCLAGDDGGIQHVIDHGKSIVLSLPLYYHLVWDYC